MSSILELGQGPVAEEIELWVGLGSEPPGIRIVGEMQGDRLSRFQRGDPLRTVERRLGGAGYQQRHHWQ